MLGLLRMIKLLQRRKHPETEVMERREDELERIMIGIPGGFFEDIVHKYSNELRRRIIKNSGCKLPFYPGSKLDVIREVLEDILEAGIELGMFTKREGVQGEYIDVNRGAMAKLRGSTYNLWAFWLVKELGLPKEVWLDAARLLDPNFKVWGINPVEIDGIRLYLKGRREEAIKLWRNARVDEDIIREYDIYLGNFLRALKNVAF